MSSRSRTAINTIPDSETTRELQRRTVIIDS
jgi:hypothetical protein